MPLKTRTAGVPIPANSRSSLAYPMCSNSSPSRWAVRTEWIWAVCGFLVLAVGLVFGQTVGHEFIGFDDQVYVYENPHVTARADRFRTMVGD